MGATACSSCSRAENTGYDSQTIPSKASKSSSKRKSNTSQSNSGAEAQANLGKFKHVMKRTFKKPKEAFNVLDRDGNNVVTKDEWLTSLNEVGEEQKWGPRIIAMMQREGILFFDEMDSNGNDELTFQEFKENLTKKMDEPIFPNLSKFKSVMKKSFKNPKEAFNILDRDGNHIVTKDEWLATLAEVGPSVGWSEEVMAMMEEDGYFFFDEMDGNGNGELVFEEFKACLAQKLNEK